MSRLAELMEECPELRIMLFTELSQDLLEQAERLIEDTRKLWQQHEEVFARGQCVGSA